MVTVSGRGSVMGRRQHQPRLFLYEPEVADYLKIPPIENDCPMMDCNGHTFHRIELPMEAIGAGDRKPRKSPRRTVIDMKQKIIAQRQKLTTPADLQSALNRDLTRFKESRLSPNRFSDPSGFSREREVSEEITLPVTSGEDVVSFAVPARQPSGFRVNDPALSVASTRKSLFSDPFLGFDDGSADLSTENQDISRRSSPPGSVYSIAGRESRLGRQSRKSINPARLDSVSFYDERSELDQPAHIKRALARPVQYHKEYTDKTRKSLRSLPGGEDEVEEEVSVIPSRGTTPSPPPPPPQKRGCDPNLDKPPGWLDKEKCVEKEESCTCDEKSTDGKGLTNFCEDCTSSEESESAEREPQKHFEHKFCPCRGPNGKKNFAAYCRCSEICRDNNCPCLKRAEEHRSNKPTCTKVWPGRSRLPQNTHRHWVHPVKRNCNCQSNRENYQPSDRQCHHQSPSAENQLQCGNQHLYGGTPNYQSSQYEYQAMNPGYYTPSQNWSSYPPSAYPSNANMYPCGPPPAHAQQYYQPPAYSMYNQPAYSHRVNPNVPMCPPTPSAFPSPYPSNPMSARANAVHRRLTKVQRMIDSIRRRVIECESDEDDEEEEEEYMYPPPPQQPPYRSANCESNYTRPNRGKLSLMGDTSILFGNGNPFMGMNDCRPKPVEMCQESEECATGLGARPRNSYRGNGCCSNRSCSARQDGDLGGRNTGRPNWMKMKSNRFKDIQPAMGGPQSWGRKSYAGGGGDEEDMPSAKPTPAGGHSAVPTHLMAAEEGDDDDSQPARSLSGKGAGESGGAGGSMGGGGSGPGSGEGSVARSGKPASVGSRVSGAGSGGAAGSGVAGSVRGSGNGVGSVAGGSAAGGSNRGSGPGTVVSGSVRGSGAPGSAAAGSVRSGGVSAGGGSQKSASAGGSAAGSRKSASVKEQSASKSASIAADVTGSASNKSGAVGTMSGSGEKPPSQGSAKSGTAKSGGSGT